MDVLGASFAEQEFCHRKWSMQKNTQQVPNSKVIFAQDNINGQIADWEAKCLMLSCQKSHRKKKYFCS